ncbi:hypothetical protein J1N35_043163 [Gossypium stocksii]|uniref:Uncharacterized protein n=1 Tax=Gossypium stocksii TaxID=47602 RepID=A0A9D3U6T7_9ROSI|nr:hypothetical protein J1N35_043163 [Gossypium stocksii]
MLTTNVDIQIVGGAGTTQGTEDSSKESSSMFRDIDEYINKTKASTTNIILSNEEEGSPRGVLHLKRKGDHSEASDSAVPIAIASNISLSLVVSLVSSSPPPKPINDDAFGVTINHDPPNNSLKLNTPSGKIEILLPWHEHLSANKFPFNPTNGSKHLSLQEIEVSLQVLLSEACMASMGLVEGVDKVEVSRIESEHTYQLVMGALTQARELYAKLDEENRGFREQN